MTFCEIVNIEKLLALGKERLSGFFDLFLGLPEKTQLFVFTLM
jgi:hypothetical protein